jgi:hypothetical protein
VSDGSSVPTCFVLVSSFQLYANNNQGPVGEAPGAAAPALGVCGSLLDSGSPSWMSGFIRGASGHTSVRPSV